MHQAKIIDRASRPNSILFLRGSLLFNFSFSTKIAISHSILAIWSLIITHFFASQHVFLCHFTGPFILGSLFFCFAVVVPGCPLFPLFAAKAHLLHILACLLHIFGHARIFKKFVTHFQDVCWTFSQLLADLSLYWNDFLLFTWCS